MKKRSGRGRHLLRRLALAAGVATAAVVPSAEAGINTAQIFVTTFKQLPDCLDYRILGLSLRVKWTPFGPYFFWTLHVGHTVPAMVNQSHPYLDKMPWQDYSNFIGNAYKAASEAVIRLAFPSISVPEAGAGRYRHHKFGKHYAPQHYESALIGHPAMIIFQKTEPAQQQSNGKTNSRYYRGSGNVPQQGGNTGNGRQPANTGDTFLGGWLNRSTPHGQFSNADKQALNYGQTMQQIDSADYIDYDRTNDSVSRSVDDYGVSNGGRYYCTLPYTPFWPYYLSGLDSVLWRRGWPFADVHKVINPFAPGPAIRPSNTLLPETWRHLYPRYGTVNHVDDAKASTVIARRGLDILADPQIGRVYWPTTKPNGVAWSKMYPEDVSCHKNIANTGTKRDEDRQYAWTNWLYTSCDLDESGQLVLRIPIGPIQVTPAIPE